MASFLSVNPISTPQNHSLDLTSAHTAPFPNPSDNPNVMPHSERDPHSANMNQEHSSRPTSTFQGNNAPSAPDEAALAESDGDRDMSDHEPEPSGDNAPPSKKKKGQRFYCTDFPPCNLSFTRSEHLARHIRKHTGERPFQCHCSRRFSRLDNLRQHAQTVHVNEEIPGDSLAATGTRFQRQIRTDRVRPQGRSRSGTAGSQGTHSRGHSRNLSTSSITSSTSAYSQPQEIRRRPPPLVMANDGSARARLSLDSMADLPTTSPSQIHGVPGPAIGSPYTPSNFYSAGGTGSPHVASPMSAASGFWDGKTAARRLSVPTGTNPFSQQHVNSYPSYVSSAAPAAYPNSGNSPANPVNVNPSQPREPRDETMSGTDGDMRRRTWHPSTYSGYQRPATSGLSNYQTPEMLQPSSSAGGSADQPTRLPGIESFDKVVSQHRPMTPVRRASPMQIDSQPRPPPGYTFGGGYNYSRPAVRPQPPVSGAGHRRGHVSWDMSLHTNLTGLNLRDNPPQRDASNWSQQTMAEIRNVGANPSTSYQHPPRPGSSVHSQEHRGNPGHGPPYERPQGWHSRATSATQAARTSPEDSSSSEGVHTPSTASLEYHPAIVHNNGYIEPHHTPISSDTSQTGYASLPPQPDSYHVHGKPGPQTDFFQNSPNRESGMGRLEALVAVATSENKDTAKLLL